MVIAVFGTYHGPLDERRGLPWTCAGARNHQDEVNVCGLLYILWMEEILHQLVDGLSHCNIL